MIENLIIQKGRKRITGFPKQRMKTGLPFPPKGLESFRKIANLVWAPALYSSKINTIVGFF